MFPLPFNFPFRKKDGSLSTLGDEMGGGSYTLPTASTDIKGGVKIGAGLTMDGEVLKNTNPTPPTPYTLPTADTDTKGGVKIGAGLAMDGETLNCIVTGGSFAKLWEWDGETSETENFEIALSSDNYDFLIVNFKMDIQPSNAKYNNSQVVIKGGNGTLNVNHCYWSSNQNHEDLAWRLIQYVDDTHYKLSNGYKSGDNASVCVVTSVYGVKL